MGRFSTKVGCKVIVLSGASGGVGRQIIPSLIEIDEVIGIYNNHPIEPQFDYLNFTGAKLDLTSSLNISKFIINHQKILQNITLVHCAAAKKDGLLINYKDSDWVDLMDVNLKANFLLTKALLPIMIKNGWGRIIHISSVAGQQGSIGAAPYGASKMALIGLSRGIAKEYAKFGITSNVIELGYFEFGLFNALSDLVKAQLLEQIPSRKLGDTKNIFNCIQFLMQSDYVNGSTINIYGGI